ncbi:MAG: DNA adenine methylase [Planctomycetia bacterium]|nr:DNA adenine methylase [Planctomycetia bacterium]
MSANYVPHPIPYQGSKRNLAATILKYAPSHVPRMIEPFAGSAAISLAAAQRKLASRFWINDAHQPLVALWSKIINRPDSIAAEYRKLWEQQLGREREYFDEVRDSFNKSQSPEHFLYLLARCVKAAIRYNALGQFNNTPDNRRKGARPEEMHLRILGASSLLKGRTRVTALDYQAVLNQCTPDDLIYMDPPYQGVCQVRDQRYAPKIAHDEFIDHLADLNRRQCLYIVSYDGRTGDKQFGKPLPKVLRLVHLEICAGRSTQATLLGRTDVTYESIYLSPALASAISHDNNSKPKHRVAFA